MPKRTMALSSKFEDGFDCNVPPFGTLFDLPFYGGWCVGVRLPTELPQDEVSWQHHLATEEIHQSHDMKPRRACEFLGGRIAMRKALRRMSDGEMALFDSPLLRNDRGAPILPLDYRGSISHKDQVAIALVYSKEDTSESAEQLTERYVGVDIENLATSRRTDLLQRRILTATESERLGSLGSTGLTVQQEVLLSFSFKEAVYKAIDPILNRYVSFKEVEVAPHADGSCEAEFRGREELASPSGCELEGSLVMRGHWLRLGDFVITTMIAAKPSS